MFVDCHYVGIIEISEWEWAVNIKQRRVLKIAAWVIVLMMLFPPVYYAPDEGIPGHHGWAVFFSDSGRVESLMLLVQFIAVGIIGYLAYLLYADSP